MKPAADIAQPGGFRYYAGGQSPPQWNDTEEDAVPLFGQGSVGELSVRWNSLLGAWTCLYNADWPADRSSVGGIVMRWANTMSTWNSYQVMLMTVDIPVPLG